MKQEMIALILTGDIESKSEKLIQAFTKPTVCLGGKYRAIDFTLSNCANSMIKKVAILSQHEPAFLSEYVGNGHKWGLDANGYSCVLLTPYKKGNNTYFYDGSADAIYKHLSYIKQYEPDYVLVTKANDIYKMDYSRMLHYHKSKNADVTISMISVPSKEISDCYYMSIDKEYKITEFANKKGKNKEVNVSMGVYIFKYSVLKKYLKSEITNLARKTHEIDEHIIPDIIYDNCKIYAYPFEGYWKDISTIDSLWQANMDLLKDDKLNLLKRKSNWKIYTEDSLSTPQYISPKANISKSIINQGCLVEGEVKNSILSNDVKIGKNAKIIDSIILPGCVIQEGAVVKKCIIGNNTIILKNEKINKENKLVTVVTGGVK